MIPQSLRGTARPGHLGPSIPVGGTSDVAQLSDRLGVTAASVHRWEATSGRLRLQSRPLVALAKLQQQAGGK